MLKSTDLKSLISSLADAPYQKIQALQGVFQFPQYSFQFLRIQGSPGANPASIANITIPIKVTKLPKQSFVSASSRLALADFLIRRFNQGITKLVQQNRGKDGSGSFHTIELSQKMIERDSILFSHNTIDLRFIFSLPAKGSGGGRFDADQTWLMFEQELIPLIDFTFFSNSYDDHTHQLLKQFLTVQQVRQEILFYMEQNNLCVFIKNGSCLPRMSGISDKPNLGAKVKTFQSPKTLEVTIPLTGSTTIQGMGIKEGITCITGGGYHGKSTLLQAILAGVYAHIPEDGREYIITREDAVFIRAEEGRSIRQVDISSFIGQLPNSKHTENFSTDNASGSTSQAASIVEAIENESRLLLFDEDTCATNFLYRDELIKEILPINNEPIKPLYTAVRPLWKQNKISMIFVIGGLGSFLQKADICLLMDNYQCKDISAKVREKLGEIIEDDDKHFTFSSNRYLSINNFNPAYTNLRLKKETPKRIKDLRNAPKKLEYGMDIINLEAIPHIVEAPQMRSIGYCLLIIRKEMKNKESHLKTIDKWLQWLNVKLEKEGLSLLQPDYPGTISLPRKYEIAAAINRIRSLRIEKT
ncbi:MAG: ABC-ATPase domain-containing protein [Methylococcales bacterium]|nr:ABC-ATPase domain-containing protein [Methylococcales bacterium]